MIWNLIELVPEPKVAPLQLTAVLVTEEEISVQLVPASTDPNSLSVVPSAALSVPVIVCEAVCKGVPDTVFVREGVEVLVVDFGCVGVIGGVDVPDIVRIRLVLGVPVWEEVEVLVEVLVPVCDGVRVEVPV